MKVCFNNLEKNLHFTDSSPLPPPFNIIPSSEPIYDLVFYLVGWRKSLHDIPIDRSKRKIEQQRRKIKYQKVIQKLVRRYVQEKVSLEQNHDLLKESDLHDLQVELSGFKEDMLMHERSRSRASSRSPRMNLRQRYEPRIRMSVKRNWKRVSQVSTGKF